MAFLKVCSQQSVEVINLDQVAYIQYVPASEQAAAVLRLVSAVDVSSGTGQSGTSINYGGALADGIAAALDLRPLQQGSFLPQIVEQFEAT